MFLKKIFRDPSLFMLLAFNAYCLIYYEQHPDRFYDVVWLYWGQSVLIGLFNFADLLTLKHVIPGSMTLNDKPVNDSSGKGCAAFFFLFHYQFFHLGYMIFISIESKGRFDRKFVAIGLAVVAAELLVNFIRNKMRQQHEAANVGKLFFLPYLRIIPMHLMILLPAFLGWKSSIIFLVLKTFADLIMYLITSRRSATTVNP